MYFKTPKRLPLAMQSSVGLKLMKVVLRKTMAKHPRTIESFSKDALVYYLKEHVYGVDLSRLQKIEDDLEWQKLEIKFKAHFEQTHKALKTKNMKKYYELRVEYENLDKARQR